MRETETLLRVASEIRCGRKRNIGRVAIDHLASGRTCHRFFKSLAAKLETLNSFAEGPYFAFRKSWPFISTKRDIEFSR
jgi:hypothetical protein